MVQFLLLESLYINHVKMMSKWLERVLCAVATAFMRPTGTNTQSGKMAMSGETEERVSSCKPMDAREVGDGRNLQCPLQAHVLIFRP